MILAALALLSLSGPARAGDDPGDGLDENTVSGTPAPIAPMPNPPVAAPTADPADTPPDLPPALVPEDPNAAYPRLSVQAAEILHLDVAFADRCRRAIEFIYARKYKEAKRSLDLLSVDYPTTGIGPAGLAVIYQALMFENFDYRYEKQYEEASDLAFRQIAEGQKITGNEAIEWFLRAGMEGIAGIHKMRRGEYLAALAEGLAAVNSLAEAKAAAPDFVDPRLGDGMYMYWRTVISRQTALLPDGPDEREAGKALMKQVESEGVLLGPAATLALTYSFIEEHDLKNALARTMYGRLKYPDNVINNMTAGRVLTSMRHYDEAAGMYKAVLTAAPDNQRAHYFLGVVYSRQAKFPEAEAEFTTYTAFAEPPPAAQGAAWYRLGLLYVRQGRTAEARTAYEKAVSIGHNEAARKALGTL